MSNTKFSENWRSKSNTTEGSKSIYKEMMDKIETNRNHYSPENKNRWKMLKELLQKNENIYENYENKRQDGENDLYISSLIHQDSIEWFISYVNRKNFSLSSKILPSIIETNSFLTQKKYTTVIKYAAFFGSFQNY